MLYIHKRANKLSLRIKKSESLWVGLDLHHSSTRKPNEQKVPMKASGKASWLILITCTQRHQRLINNWKATVRCQQVAMFGLAQVSMLIPFDGNWKSSLGFILSGNENWLRVERSKKPATLWLWLCFLIHLILIESLM